MKNHGFHDFPMFFGKSAVYLIRPPKLCAGLMREGGAAVVSSSRGVPGSSAQAMRASRGEQLMEQTVSKSVAGERGDRGDLRKHGERVPVQYTLRYTETSFSRVSSAHLNLSLEKRRGRKEEEREKGKDGKGRKKKRREAGKRNARNA